MTRQYSRTYRAQAICGWPKRAVATRGRMAMAGSTASAHRVDAQQAGGGSYRSALAMLASLFFMWGFITVINNTLLPHLRSVFALNYTQTTLIESVWFIAYFRRVDPVGEADRTDRLPAFASRRAGHHGGGCAGHDGGGEPAVLRGDAGHAVRHRQRDHAAAGRGQPVCRGDRAARDVVVAAQSRPGDELRGDDARAAVRCLSHPRPVEGRHRA